MQGAVRNFPLAVAALPRTVLAVGYTVLATSSALLATGCAGSVDSAGTNPSTTVPVAAGSVSGSPTTAVGIPAGSGTGTIAAPAGSTGSSGVSPFPDCAGSDLVAAKRIVRLSFNQIANSIGSLLNSTLGKQISADFELVDSEHRAFPPLQSPREGNSLTDLSWSTIDRIAKTAGDYVTANFASVTQCGETPTDDCAKGYLTSFAQKAYRRPLTTAEQTRLTTLYTTNFRGEGASVKESVQYGIYAILQAPQFVYRTELGSNWQEEGKLTQPEMASLVSYFLTDNTPDQALLDAVAQNKLDTPQAVEAQVDRLLKTPAAKANLQGAMISYFSYPNLESQVIQDDAFTGDMRRSMFREAQLFLEKTLWGAPLNDLLVSRKAYINATLAPLYGITQFPPPGAVLDAEKFAEVTLPANRTGLLTQVGFLANRSRPDHTSVIGRGLLIKNAFLCTETPEPPEGLADTIKMVSEVNASASERELAKIRGETPPCNGCHLTFDAYGLALDTFDVLGRYRSTDAEGRAIDPSVTLPTQVGGGTAKDIVEVAQKLAAADAFSKCMGQNLVNYALADVSAGAASLSSCAVKRVAEGFRASDGSFSSLVKSVATSAVFSSRLKGVNQ